MCLPLSTTSFGFLIWTKKEGENLEIETVEHNSSCGKCGEDLCLSGPNFKEEDAAVSIGGQDSRRPVSPEVIIMSPTRKLAIQI